jgi:hypothetical protein
MLGGAAQQVNAKKAREEGKESGRLEAGTTTVGSGAPSDGSQGKLNIEKAGKRKEQVPANKNNLPVC